MRENLMILIVFMSQIFVVSFFFSRRILKEIQGIIANYPPEQYPNLYPVPENEIKRAQSIFNIANLTVLFFGLFIALISFFSLNVELLGMDSQSIISLYFLLQLSPILIIYKNPGFIFFNIARKIGSNKVYSAELKRRSFFDFVSLNWLVAAGIIYIAIISFILAKPELWGAGNWNILFITLLNVFFLAVAFYHLYWERRDPYLDQRDKNRQIEVGVNFALFGSIAASLFLLVHIGVKQVAPGLEDVVQSLYFQILTLVSLKAFSTKNIDFEVYKEKTQ